MPPLEKTVVKKILAYIQSRGGFAFKVHGSPFQKRGVSDILGCYRGRFIAFEVKRDSKGVATPLQINFLKKTRAAGGVAALVHSVEEVETILDRVDSLRRPKAPDQD